MPLVLKSYPEYFSPSLGPFLMDDTSPLHLPPPNSSLFEDFTAPPLPGLGIRVPPAGPITEPHSPSPVPDEPTYYGSDITRLRDDTTYTAAENSSDSAGGHSSGEMLMATADPMSLPVGDGFPSELVDMTMNMNMDFGSSALTPEHEAHTSLVVNLSMTGSTPDAAGPEPSSPVHAPLTAAPLTATRSTSQTQLRDAPLAASTPLNHFERSRAPPPSLGSYDNLVGAGPPAVLPSPEEENQDDALRAVSAASTPSNLDDNPLRQTPSFSSPPLAQTNSHSGWHHDHDHDLEVDHDQYTSDNNEPPPDDDPMAHSGVEDDDADDPPVNQEHYESRLREWSLSTIEEWKDKLMTVVLRALPTSGELETIQRERMQKKNGHMRTKLTNRQASALDKGKHMFQEITRIFLDMLDVPSSVGAQRLGRWSPYLLNDSPWNMWQRKWAAEHEEDDFVEERCRQAYHVFVQENSNYREILGTWERSHPRADGQKLTETQRLRRWTHFTREMQDRATTWEQTHGFSSIVLACTLVPEDKFDQFTFFHETPQMSEFSIQRLGQTSYNARLLAYHWLGCLFIYP
ncbi:hypothetical protein CALCODRAFT_506497 [Calocera cornea HHB12733]|uniref:Uncharacterized protein n=1 Tax=Calocera cornea HHB12733 TaxID=1353952 RepID=A0A165IX41_9BASI|nr:hypothetical protein CALCODRAFT_506497 [Calocera cornea HHB12733]